MTPEGHQPGSLLHPPSETEPDAIRRAHNAPPQPQAANAHRYAHGLDMNTLLNSLFSGSLAARLNHCRRIPFFMHKGVYQGIARVAAAIAVALLFCPPHARGQNSTDVTAWIQHVAFQVKELKSAMIACRIEMQEQTILLIERELRDIHKDQLRLHSEEALLKRQVEQTDNHTAAPSADADAAQLDMARATLIASESERFKNEHASLTQREAEARERLRAAHERGQMLSQEAKKM